MKKKFIFLLVAAYLQGCSHLSVAPSREVLAKDAGGKTWDISGVRLNDSPEILSFKGSATLRKGAFVLVPDASMRINPILIFQQEEIGALQVIEESGTPENRNSVTCEACEKIAKGAAYVAITILAAAVIAGLAMSKMNGDWGKAP